MRGYPGIAAAYQVLRERALALRQEVIFLPAREALLECLIRISLGQGGPITVPAEAPKPLPISANCCAGC